ncbi:hypothetical protein H6F67_25310 [Microcoleus sp. FACHB-1515]|uniref:hypothetical protein n=1 Tax=Cyanophyceae TaxID=3028117 RepID=UPI001682FCB1|nr:hypothetical protein [Microcoleus sp. FACHB-1515]MBD2093168.1 hypothetical protein [Microcoleus sp. FACHB-1515]
MQHIETHIERTPGAHSAHYTAQAIAAEHSDLAKEVTIRTRWYPWIAKVAPEPLLKTEQGFTELARSLFADYAQHVKRDGMTPTSWVESAKARYSQEWQSAGVIEAEVLPPEVGGTLALASVQVSTLTQTGEERKARLLRMIEQNRSAEGNLSQSRREIAEQRGINAALDEFEIELEAKTRTLNQLRQLSDY